MLGEPLQRLPREVQAIELRVLAFQRRDDAQALRVVIEAAVGVHGAVQRPLPRVPERRMTEIVGKRDGFGEILIEAQLARHGAGDLRHLQRVGQARAIVVALVEDEHLRLVGEPPEGGRMQHPVAIALEGAARGALRLRVEAPAARHGARRIGRRAALAGAEAGAIVGMATFLAAGSTGPVPASAASWRL